MAANISCSLYSSHRNSLQGIYLLVLHQVGWMFEDDARRLVADKICEVIAKGAAWPEQCRSRISDYEQDPIFVAFYYSHAPAHLVEWARRRRSYHYLGWTVSIGAVLGVGLGFCWVGWVNEVSWKNLNDLSIGFILGGTLVAIASALILATRMQRDVDQMEALIAYDQRGCQIVDLGVPRSSRGGCTTSKNQ
jgi:hypothetical protein